MPDGLKLTSASYVDFLKKHMVPAYKKLKKQKKAALLFMHDNAPAHAEKIHNCF